MKTQYESAAHLESLTQIYISKLCEGLLLNKIEDSDYPPANQQDPIVPVSMRRNQHRKDQEIKAADLPLNGFQALVFTPIGLFVL